MTEQNDKNRRIPASAKKRPSPNSDAERRKIRKRPVAQTGRNRTTMSGDGSLGMANNSTPNRKPKPPTITETEKLRIREAKLKRENARKARDLETERNRLERQQRANFKREYELEKRLASKRLTQQSKGLLEAQLNKIKTDKTENANRRRGLSNSLNATARKVTEHAKNEATHKATVTKIRAAKSKIYPDSVTTGNVTIQSGASNPFKPIRNVHAGNAQYRSWANQIVARSKYRTGGARADAVTSSVAETLQTAHDKGYRKYETDENGNEIEVTISELIDRGITPGELWDEIKEYFDTSSDDFPYHGRVW